MSRCLSTHPQSVTLEPTSDARSVPAPCERAGQERRSGRTPLADWASAADDSDASTALAVTTPRVQPSFLGVAVTRARACVDAHTLLPALGARLAERRVAAWVAMVVGSLCGNGADAAAAWLVAAEARTAFARRARVDEDPRTFDRAGRIDASVRVRSNPRACEVGLSRGRRYLSRDDEGSSETLFSDREGN